MILDVHRDLFSRSEVERVYGMVCQDLGIRPPTLKWTERARNGYYGCGEVVIGPRCWRRWYVALHELAHHVAGFLYPRAADHGPEFREALEMVAATALGDPALYAWSNEYRSIARWAAGGRKKLSSPARRGAGRPQGRGVRARGSVKATPSPAVGFTGTRRGMSTDQIDQLVDLIQRLRPRALHHGDCVGADEEAHSVASDLDVRTVAHPPSNPRARAWCEADEYREPLPYLDRNHRIVDETDLLVAAPAGPEILRSGTWATVRYARKVGRRVVILEREEER